MVRTFFYEKPGLAPVLNQLYKDKQILMKYLLVILLITPLSLFAQTSKSDEFTTGTRVKEYKQNDVVYKRKQIIQIGYGSRNNGDFKFIYTSPYAPLAGIIYLNHSSTGGQLEIKYLLKTGTKKTGFKTVAVCGAKQAIDYWVDLDSAAVSKEILLPNEKFIPMNSIQKKSK